MHISKLELVQLLNDQMKLVIIQLLLYSRLSDEAMVKVVKHVIKYR